LRSQNSSGKENNHGSGPGKRNSIAMDWLAWLLAGLEGMEGLYAAQSRSNAR
jgi:hypothetical protein